MGTTSNATSRILQRLGTQAPTTIDARANVDAGGPLRAQHALTRSRGWHGTFVGLAVLLFFVVDHFTGLDMVAATSRFLWNGIALTANGTMRATGGALAVAARSLGWRRLSRLATVMLGVGLGYSGSVILSERGLTRARGWTGRIKRSSVMLRGRWLDLHLIWKLALVATLIASQIYLHFLLIIFPIAFLIPVVRRVWVRVLDLVFGRWYWKMLGPTHRAVMVHVRELPGVRHSIDAVRLERIRYLRAWRLWKYDPRYRHPVTGTRRVSLVEPMRLWWRGDLDGYVGRHLLGGAARATSRR